jgi:hypothetical protein
MSQYQHRQCVSEESMMILDKRRLKKNTCWQVSGFVLSLNTRMIKSKIKWIWHTTHVGEIGHVYKVLVAKPERTRLLARPWYRWVQYIKWTAYKCVESDWDPGTGVLWTPQLTFGFYIRQEMCWLVEKDSVMWSRQQRVTVIRCCEILVQ